MAIQDDWTLNYTAKTITHTGGSTVYTVLAFYSWLMDLFDDAAQMDDPVPMSAQTPVEFSLINGWTIPDASFEFLTGGAITDTSDDTVWANVYTLGSIASGSQVYIIQDGVELPIFWGTDHIDILVMVQDAGVLINNGDLLVMIRDTGNTFDHYEVDCSAGGRNAVPLATASDLNNQTIDGTVAGWSDISVTFGTVSKDLNNGNGAVDYDVVVSCASRPLAEVYEYLKYICRHNSAHPTTGEDYIAAIDGYTEVKSAPFGTFAGGKFFGARGVWLEGYDGDDTNNIQLIDSTGTPQVPPISIAVKVTGVAIGDRVLVGQLDGVGGTLTGTDYIDEDATSTTSQHIMTYSANIPVLVRVRKKGILPFEVESAITSTGMSVAAIRTVDTIVS